MTISSRTPEGLPSRCPLCGAATELEYSDPGGDATCPNCGYLLWRSSVLLERLRRLLAESHGVASEKIDADTPLRDLFIDSLDWTELILELEEEFEMFDIEIPHDDAEQLNTLGDLIRYWERRRKNQ